MRRRLSLLLTLTSLLVVALSSSAKANGQGNFIVGCGWSHQGQYDPILTPGKAGVSHLHDFFGYRKTSLSLGSQELKRASKDPSLHSCLLKGDGSAYWVPALYQAGRRIQPTEAWAYYLKPGVAGKIEAYPPGLRIIAGEMHARSAQTGVISWYCDFDNTLKGRNGYPPECGSVLPFDNPDQSDRQDQTRLVINFPYCWSGELGVGSAVYPEEGKCPKGHSRLLPQLQLNLLYPTKYPGDKLSLSSGSILGAHADFVSGWDTGKLKKLIDRCLNAGRSCGRQRDRKPAKALKPSRPILGEQIRQSLGQGI